MYWPSTRKEQRQTPLARTVGEDFSRLHQEHREAVASACQIRCLPKGWTAICWTQNALAYRWVFVSGSEQDWEAGFQSPTCWAFMDITDITLGCPSDRGLEWRSGAVKALAVARAHVSATTLRMLNEIGTQRLMGASLDPQSISG